MQKRARFTSASVITSGMGCKPLVAQAAFPVHRKPLPGPLQCDARGGCSRRVCWSCQQQHVQVVQSTIGIRILKGNGTLLGVIKRVLQGGQEQPATWLLCSEVLSNWVTPEEMLFFARSLHACQSLLGNSFARWLAGVCVCVCMKGRGWPQRREPHSRTKLLPIYSQPSAHHCVWLCCAREHMWESV